MLYLRQAMKMGEALSPQEITEMIEAVDPKHTGKILYEPFCAYVLSK